ncbi:MAG: apolipoprotein N-acyltransferase, partial [Candidatus Cybelea sp.]
AVQGNIPQSFKWSALALAVRRYTEMTLALDRVHPRLIVWPETAIPTAINLDPGLLSEFSGLARRLDSTIVAGGIDAAGPRIYNALYIFAPDGTSNIYRKRQLVAFAEWFPGRAFLSWLPYIGALNGGLTRGKDDGVYSTTALSIAPLICWESAFSDLAYAQLQRNAQILVVSTDDAWFGTTSGPYMHAQIAQLRAVESGAYVVRAAATGISGIVAPDGKWQTRSRIERQTTVIGRVGRRVPTIFARIGPTRIAFAMIALYALLFLVPRARAEFASSREP